MLQWHMRNMEKETEMKKIVVVDAVSTGANFIADIMKRGYEPVALIPYAESGSYFSTFDKHALEAARKKYPCDPLTIHASKKYEETLAVIRGLDPVLVIAGSEGGVELATQLAADLDLVGNPVENMDAYTKKTAMHAALAKAGVRNIRGRIVHTYEEACAFMEEINTENVVLKPIHSAGSLRVRLCSSAEEVRKGFEELLGSEDFYGEKIDTLLIQERIFGTEYIVNTMSRHGRHKVLSMRKYDKVKTDQGSYIYNYCESVNELGAGHSELIEYAFSVLDAIGITDGPVHGEYMIDKKGPVLIEVNCRPMGGGMPSKFLDMIAGHHETDAILDAYLDEENFISHLDDPYRMKRKGILKDIITPKDIDVTASPIKVIIDHLQSLYCADLQSGSEIFHLSRTEDLETASGEVYLIHDDPEVVKRECDLLHLLETKYFRILYHGIGAKETPKDEHALSVAEAVRIADPVGCSLIVSDLPIDTDGILCVSPDELNKAPGMYDQVFFALSSYGEGHEVEATVQAIFDAMEKVKNGGRFIVPETFYQLVPYGRAFIEALLTIAGFEIEAPTYNKRRIVSGKRK